MFKTVLMRGHNVHVCYAKIKEIIPKLSMLPLLIWSIAIVDGVANNVEPDQTALLGAVWSESALFAQT